MNDGYMGAAAVPVPDTGHDTLRAEVNKLNQQRTDLTAQPHEAAQPDRPEPVDPASVRVGDIVEVVQQHDDIPLRITVEGEVYQLGRDGDSRHLFHIRGYGGPAIGDVTTVRILHRPEPDPDEAAVEALTSTVHIALGAVGPPGEYDDWRKWSGRVAYLLAREGYVVSTDE